MDLVLYLSHANCVPCTCLSIQVADYFIYLYFVTIWRFFWTQTAFDYQVATKTRKPLRCWWVMRRISCSRCAKRCALRRRRPFASASTPATVSAGCASDRGTRNRSPINDHATSWSYKQRHPCVQDISHQPWSNRDWSQRTAGFRAFCSIIIYSVPLLPCCIGECIIMVLIPPYKTTIALHFI